MKLTTKGRYAVTAMLDLAIAQGHGPIALAEIAQRQAISLSYLEQLFAKLRHCQLVRSVRGPGGGYVLTRAPALISVADVIRAVDDNLDTTRCGGACNCQNDGPCLAHALWYELGLRIDSYLNAVTLQELLDQAAAGAGKNSICK
jgi:Rrf2 family transcriptional regulator, iron-sulfur cluster assembly transcription factor